MSFYALRAAPDDPDSDFETCDNAGAATVAACRLSRAHVVYLCFDGLDGPQAVIVTAERTVSEVLAEIKLREKMRIAWDG